MADQIKIYSTSPSVDSNNTPIPVAIIDSNTIFESFDLNLIGAGVEDFIVSVNENFVKLLENFSGAVKPPKADTDAGIVEGQIWFNSSTGVVYYRGSNGWVSNSNKLAGKTLDAVREFVLSGIDTSGKLSITGGTITGDINVNGPINAKGHIIPVKNEISNLGSANNRFRNIYLKEDGIVLGDSSKQLNFKPHNFVYVVANDDVSVANFPVGAIILHQETGEAIIKKATGKFDTTNNTFRKLADDKQNSAIVGGNKFTFMGDKGLFAGAGATFNSSIESLNITTTSNANNFGNLSVARIHIGSAMSNGSKCVFPGGYAASRTDVMDYVVISTPSNATKFGSFGKENYGASAVSDGTRGVIGPGYDGNGTGHHHIAKYITIDTLSDATNFGTISQGYYGSAISSGTRGIFAGYSRTGAWDGKLDYITIQTPSNSLSFGSLIRHRGAGNAAVTDMNRGVFIGGYNGNWNSNWIEYITIATLSNATDFGKTIRITTHGGAVCNGYRGVFNSSAKSLEYINVVTPSNSSEFGNLLESRQNRPACGSGN